MGYVDDQVAAYRKTMADAVAGKGLQKAIRALQDKTRIADSLKPLPSRGAIVAKRRVAKRTGSGEAIGGDRIEQARSYFTTQHELRSSDGLFVLQYSNVRTIIFDTGTDTFLDYDPG